MNKVTELQSYQESKQVKTNGISEEQIQILKQSICKDLTNDELKVFLMACYKTQLDPFMRQIYAVKRDQKQRDGSYIKVMTIQTGIDGYRLIAERTGLYSPGQEPSYSYNNEGNLVSATAYVKKQTKDGSWHIVSSSAFIDEYMQTYVDRKTGEKKPSGKWADMPRTMLAKCAESQALRRAFPAEMSGVYTKEEMDQADDPKVDLHEVVELQNIIDCVDEEYRNTIFSGLAKMQITNICDLAPEIFNKVKISCLKRIEKNLEKQKQIEIQKIQEEKNPE